MELRHITKTYPGVKALDDVSISFILAAVPLFLIWLNFSWQIIIYGAQLTYSFQNVDKYNVSAWDTEAR